MSLTEKNLENEVFNYLNHLQIPSASLLIVGLSGGPDSTALLLCLNELKNKLKIKISAAYINHGMRDAADLKRDDGFVETLCHKLDLQLFCKKIDPGIIEHISNKDNRSTEDVARELRYSYFNEILALTGSKYLALGHNLDDQFETIISRFFQGSGINGLKGIPLNKGVIIRPLNSCRKDEIMKYLIQHQQHYSIDSTNSENNYLRNKIRNILIPEISQIFPGYASSLISQQQKFLELHEYFNEITESMNIVYNSENCSVSLDLFNNQHKLVRLNILYKMFDYAYSGTIQSYRVSEGFFNPLLQKNLIEHQVYAKAHGIKIFTNNDTLFLERFYYESTGFYTLIEKEEIIIPSKFCVTIKEHSPLKIKKISHSPLIFRSRKDGDIIIVDDKNITISSIFKKWNLKNSDRDMIPILEDSLGIIAVLGEFSGYQNIFRKKKNNSSEKFNILYLDVRKIFHE